MHGIFPTHNKYYIRHEIFPYLSKSEIRNVYYPPKGKREKISPRDRRPKASQDENE